MLTEDEIRLVAGLHGWKTDLHRLHPDNPVYDVILYWRRRRHCLGLLGELQCMTIEQLAQLVAFYAERIDGCAVLDESMACDHTDHQAHR
jgi:hypothetical protein